MRLLAARVRLGGRWLSVTEVLNDPQLCGLLSGEGPWNITELRKITGW